MGKDYTITSALRNNVPICHTRGIFHGSISPLLIYYNDILVYMYIVVIILECAQRAERKMCGLEKSKPVIVCAS